MSDITLNQARNEAELKDLFRELDKEIDGAIKSHEVELSSLFASLGTVVDIANQAQADLDRTAATKFSIFDYFHEKETDLSRIFAGLLEPTGGHGQGDRFLSLFLKEMPCCRDEPSKRLRDVFRCVDLHECKVHLEYMTNKGRRIDIVLEIADRWIGIENKPWAGEQEEQLKDYIEDLQKKGTAWVLYLSGDGSEPTTRPDGKAGNCCPTVPYRESDGKSSSIENWVQQCWRECEAERVRWFLKDLLEYIQQSFELANTPITEEK